MIPRFTEMTKQKIGLPKFYGHFITALPTQKNRTINAIILEYVEDTGLCLLVPHEEADAVYSLHKGAVIEAALLLFLRSTPQTCSSRM